MDEGSKKDYSEQEVPPVEQTIITNDILDMSMKKWSYLSYFLLILAFSTSNEMDYFESSGNDVPLYFTFLYVMAVLSFLRYNYLRYLLNLYFLRYNFYENNNHQA